MKQINEVVENNLQIAQLFEVEELEERVEFGKWSGKAEGGYTCSGGDCDGKMKVEATYTIKF
ncbi:hypothetical protein MM236_13545 [Belliella sp. DSM 107340]|uniref:Uncharacterized protein n=1 Tax=Belliella calami TaxID=2923436 RepID=A0ABS9URG3_9BACT|nr:hypothetical protein [Belliella calami]MCH7399024.1 hypothetical protein [Belliella calami]